MKPDKSKSIVISATGICLYRLETCVHHCFLSLKHINKLPLLIGIGGSREAGLKYVAGLECFKEIHDRLLRMKEINIAGIDNSLLLHLVRDLGDAMCIFGCLNIEDVLYVQSCVRFLQQQQEMMHKKTQNGDVDEEALLFVDFEKALLTTGSSSSRHQHQQYLGKFDILKQFVTPLVRVIISPISSIDSPPPPPEEQKKKKKKSPPQMDFKRWEIEGAEGAAAAGIATADAHCVVECVSTTIYIDKCLLAIEVFGVFTNDVSLRAIIRSNDFVRRKHSALIAGTTRFSGIQGTRTMMDLRLECLTPYEVVVVATTPLKGRSAIEKNMSDFKKEIARLETHDFESNIEWFLKTKKTFRAVFSFLMHLVISILCAVPTHDGEEVKTLRSQQHYFKLFFFICGKQNGSFETVFFTHLPEALQLRWGELTERVSGLGLTSSPSLQNIDYTAPPSGTTTNGSTLQRGSSSASYYEEKIGLKDFKSEAVMEKAQQKLREIQSKNDDSSCKARHYLDGLLKIPFGVFRKEPILRKAGDLKTEFTDLWRSLAHAHVDLIISPSPNNREMLRGIELFETIISNDEHKTHQQEAAAEETGEEGEGEGEEEKDCSNILALARLKCKLFSISDDLTMIHKRLDTAVYGHSKAKKKIVQIFGQWMSGGQAGYCIGFEGSHGIGKTSLAKMGVAECLYDEDGRKRPFAFIALGGSSNGSTLEGHNYTYVNAVWGKIVDILIESKCMNPIIYIDELDKVSKTETGREIIGILTHITDSTQNEEFQDKFFAGIKIDLSKVLFIFSYNDPANIDPVLLDRINVVKFDNLSIADKVVIVKKHLIPEMNLKFGLAMGANIISIDDETIRFIVETYTMEPGVRKLRDILYEIYSVVNLEILDCKTTNNDGSCCREITVENVQSKFLKQYPILKKTASTSPSSSSSSSSISSNVRAAGIVNGLWASSAVGRGGVIHIEARFSPLNVSVASAVSAASCNLHLTGLQGNVMKESMQVAHTLAFSLLASARSNCGGCVGCGGNINNNNNNIHIHCPEASVAKDGPSAGCAVTLAIYSLLTGTLIDKDVAMTGEVDLEGNVREVGGLEEKILGGIDEGIRRFIVPRANHVDVENFINKCADDEYMSRRFSFQTTTINSPVLKKDELDDDKDRGDVVYLFQVQRVRDILDLLRI